MRGICVVNTLCDLGASAFDEHPAAVQLQQACYVERNHHNPCFLLIELPPPPLLLVLLVLLQMSTTGSCRSWRVTRATCWRCWQAVRQQHGQLEQQLRRRRLLHPAVAAQAAAWQLLQVLQAVGTGVGQSSKSSRACLPQPLGRAGGHLLLLVAAVGSAGASAVAAAACRTSSYAHNCRYAVKRVQRGCLQD
jgi:hypothetical protein